MKTRTLPNIRTERIICFVQVDSYSLLKLHLQPNSAYECRHIKFENAFAGIRAYTSFAGLNLTSWDANRRFKVYKCVATKWCDDSNAGMFAIKMQSFKVYKQVNPSDWNIEMQHAMQHAGTFFALNEHHDLTVCSNLQRACNHELLVNCCRTFNIQWIDKHKPLSTSTQSNHDIKPMIVEQFAYAFDNDFAPSFKHNVLPDCSVVDKHWVWHEGNLLSVVTVRTMPNGKSQTNIKYLKHFDMFCAPIYDETSSIKQLSAYKMGQFYSVVNVEWQDNIQIVHDSNLTVIQHRESDIAKLNKFVDNECVMQQLYSTVVEKVANCI